jgi:hypothetical protein
MPTDAKPKFLVVRTERAGCSFAPVISFLKLFGPLV